MRDRGKCRGRKTETCCQLCVHLKWQWKKTHQWGTNERDSVMVGYVTVWENSVKLWRKGWECVTISHYSSTAVWMDLSRVECLAPINLRGLECVHVWVPEGREDVIFFLSLEEYAGGGGGCRGRPSRSPSPAQPLHIEEYPEVPKTGNSFSPPWMECL